MQSFSELALSTQISKAIADLGFEKPSPIQAQALPLLLGDRTDFIGLAATGTGKTAAFAIPLLEKIETDARGVQALILCPTRELALQVASQVNLIGRYKRVRSVAVYGGSSYADQIRGLREGAQVVVGTPGRVVDHIERGTLRLDNLKTIILDEADEMISMGFKDELEKVLAAVPRDESNIWLFSATMSREVRKVADAYLRSPKQVQVNREEMLSSTVEQYYYPTQENNKAEILCKLIEGADDFYGLIFCQTKALVVDLTQFLSERGYKVDSLHGDKDQSARERTMTAFRNRRVNILVCTDVASRGLDVKDITHVVNYSLPRELENYVHRIGRTARSGKTGIAMNLVTLSHRRLIYAIENLTKSKMLEGKIPTRREIGARKIAKRLETFMAQAYHQRAVEVMSDEWKTAVNAMTPEEVAGRFITMMMPDVFNDHVDAARVAAAGNKTVVNVKSGGSASSRDFGPSSSRPSGASASKPSAAMPPYVKAFVEPKAPGAAPASKPSATFASDEPGYVPARASRAASKPAPAAPKASRKAAKPAAEAAVEENLEEVVASSESVEIPSAPERAVLPLAEAVAILKSKPEVEADLDGIDGLDDLDLDFELDSEEELEVDSLLGSLDKPVVFDVPEEKPAKAAKARRAPKAKAAAKAAELDAELDAEDEMDEASEVAVANEAKAPKLPRLPKVPFTKKPELAPILTDSKASPFAKSVSSPFAPKRKFESDRQAPRRAAGSGPVPREGGYDRPRTSYDRGPRASDDRGPSVRRPGDRAPRASFGAGPGPRPMAARGPSAGSLSASRGPRPVSSSASSSASRSEGPVRKIGSSTRRAKSADARAERAKQEPRATVGDVTRELMSRSRKIGGTQEFEAPVLNRRARRALQFSMPGTSGGKSNEGRE